MAWSPLQKLFHGMCSLLSRIWSKGSDVSRGTENDKVVERHERVTRFIVRKDHFTATRVKWNAFLPYDNPVSGRLETSTYRELQLPAAELWRLGREHVEKPDRQIRARATGPAAAIIASGLTFDVNGPPEPIHADIIGWSTDKDERRQKAMEFVGSFQPEVAPPR
jgi:hypothetical protein